MHLTVEPRLRSTLIQLMLWMIWAVYPKMRSTDTRDSLPSCEQVSFVGVRNKFVAIIFFQIP